MVTVVEQEKRRLDSLIIVYKASIAERDKELAKRDVKIAQKLSVIKSLQDSLEIVKNNSFLYTVDASYDYLNNRIPPVTEQKYRFDSTQVKLMHYSFLERDGLFLLNTKKGLVIEELNLSSFIKDNQIVELKDLNLVYLKKEAILNKEKQAQAVEIESLQKVIRKQKTQKLVSSGLLVGTVGIIVVKALLK